MLRFWFHERNFDEERRRYRSLVATARRSGSRLSFLDFLPPCVAAVAETVRPDIAGGGDGSGRRDPALTLSAARPLVVCENACGPEFATLNRAFANSPYVSDRCRRCGHLASAVCRGLPNERFLREKEEIEARIGRDAYVAVRADYQIGAPTLGSICNGRCRFCYDRRLRAGPLCRVPWLRMDEVRHFLFHLGAPIRYVGSTAHCVSGEPTIHPEIDGVLAMLARFASPSRRPYVFTNGLAVTSGLCERLAGRFGVALSLHILDPAMRARWLGYRREFDARALVRMLERHRVDHSIWILPLRSTVESGEFLRTYRFALGTKARQIVIEKVGWSSSHAPAVRRELDTDDRGLQAMLRGLDRGRRTKWVWRWGSGTSRRSFAEYRAEIRRRLRGRGRTIVLCPEFSWERFRDLESAGCRVLPATSTWGFVRAPCSATTIRDYAAALRRSGGRCDAVVLPARSFDARLRDLACRDLNDLAAACDRETEITII